METRICSFIRVGQAGQRLLQTSRTSGETHTVKDESLLQQTRVKMKSFRSAGKDRDEASPCLSSMSINMLHMTLSTCYMHADI
ncbi:hypothetical protein EYF80_034211 [Liparis tanakae]|uniref:Uncharacterized protein n=1 Tax=Liparis tanakae TaxID=230148 RepID=A0A4Z2GRZ3_9TELE|nr:hypothetical protein EYF80_034211 [Liparis tanakae]